MVVAMNFIIATGQELPDGGNERFAALAPPALPRCVGYAINHSRLVRSCTQCIPPAPIHSLWERLHVHSSRAIDFKRFFHAHVHVRGALINASYHVRLM